METKENAIVEYLDYQIPVTQLKGQKGNGSTQVNRLYLMSVGDVKKANIALENVATPNQKSFTFLGRIISANMSYKEHVKKIKADTKISSRIL